MDSQKWLDAARRCIAREESPRRKEVAEELHQFIDGPAGRIAIHQLLRVANTHVVFGKSQEFHPHHSITVFALIGGIRGGLVMFHEVSYRGAFSTDYRISMEPITPETAVEVAIKYSHMAPDEIMPWLFSELDRIADSIP